MIQNLIWATAHNLVAIPVAGGLFVRWGFDLPMSVGAVAMSTSTIIGGRKRTAVTPAEGAALSPLLRIARVSHGSKGARHDLSPELLEQELTAAGFVIKERIAPVPLDGDRFRYGINTEKAK